VIWVWRRSSFTLLNSHNITLSVSSLLSLFHLYPHEGLSPTNRGAFSDAQRIPDSLEAVKVSQFNFWKGNIRSTNITVA
jgi:hypothetical protein